MHGCYWSVVAAAFVGLFGGVWIGLRAGALEIRERFTSGEWTRRIDFGADRSL